MRSFKYVTALILMAIAAGAGGAVTKGPSRAGRACLFEGPTNTVATTTTTASAITEVTAAWWFRMDYPSRDFYPILTYRNSSKRLLAFGAQHEPWMYFLDNDSLSVYGSDDSFSAVPGTWWHAAFTWSSSDGVAAFFQNGESRGTQTTAKGLVIPSGGYWLFPDEMWDNKLFGHADEITVWNVRLTAAEVALVANGSTSVHASDRLLHWSCDDDNSTSVADDVSGTPAVVSSSWTSGSSLKVPSTCPNVDTNTTVLLVSAASLAVTNLSLPSGTKILSLPAAGKLLDSSSAVVVVGDSPASVKYVAPSGGLTAETTFATSYANVYLAPNHAPAPKSINTNVKAYEEVSVHAAFFTTDLEPAWDDLYEVDADGDFLTATITSLPSTGKLYQYDGTRITSVPATVTDTGLRFTYVPTDRALIGDNVSVGLSVSDGLSATTLKHIITVTATSKPPQPIDTAATTNSSGYAHVAIPITYDYLNQARLLAKAPSHGKLLDTSFNALNLTTKNVTVHQWVSSVTAYSSQWDSDNAASNVIGAPSTYPAYGNGDGAWAFGDDEGAMEYIEVKFATAVIVTNVTIFEIYDGNSVTRIAQLASDGVTWETLFSRAARTTAAPTTAVAFSPALSMPTTSHAITSLRIEFQVPAGEWPEIDAIKLIGTTQMTVASIPSSDSVIYERATSGPDYVDTFEVITEQTADLLARLSYSFITAYATVTVTVTSESTPSRAGLACLFEGPENSISSGSYSSTITEITASWWFRMDYPSSDFFPILTYRNASQRLLAFGAQHAPWIYLMEDDSLSVYGTDDSFEPVPGRWYHAAFSWRSSDGQVSFYQDGTSRGSATTAKGFVVPAGGYWTFPDELWDEKLFGHADEITVWNVCLSDSEIALVANGNLTVASENRVLHWSCDDDSNHSVADDVSLIPANISTSWKSSALKVPSTCPEVNVNVTYIAVLASSSSVTTLTLPSSTTVLSLPTSGKLVISGTSTSVLVGESPAALDYIAPSAGLTSVVSFNTSFSLVYLTPNHAPVIKLFSTSAKAFDTTVLHSAYFNAEGTLTWEDVYSADADGDLLTAKVTSLPSSGQLFQYDGTEITSVPTTLTDSGLRFKFVPLDSALIGDNITLKISVTDGLSTVSVTRAITVSATTKPPTPQNTSTSTDETGDATFTIPVSYNYQSQAQLLAMAPSKGKLKNAATGKSLSFATKNVVLHQWAHAVLNYSSQWNENNAATNALNAPVTYPEYGNGESAWAFGDDEGEVEWIELRYDMPVIVTNITVYEIYDGNSVIRIAQRASDGVSWETLFSRAARTTAAPQVAVAFSPALMMPSKSHAVRDIRIEFQVPAGEWPEIDAIKLVGTSEMEVASVPSTNTLLYHRTEMGPTTDSFKVLVEQTEQLISRLSYFTESTLATVSVSITETVSGAGCASVTAVLLLATLASLLL